MHLVGLAFEPFEKTAHAVPAIALPIIIRVSVGAFLAVDYEILVGLRQFLEGPMQIDLLARARPNQIALRFAKLLALKRAHHALRDA